MHRLAYDKHGGGYLYSDSVVRRPFEPVSHDHDTTSVLHGDMDGVTGKYHWSIYRYAWLAAIIIKTTYCYMWDVTMDWDLGKVGRGQHRKYPLLRKSLMYPWTW